MEWVSTVFCSLEDCHLLRCFPFPFFVLLFPYLLCTRAQCPRLSVLHDGNPAKRLWVRGQACFPNANEVSAPTCLWARIEKLSVGIQIIWIVSTNPSSFYLMTFTLRSTHEGIPCLKRRAILHCCEKIHC